MSDDPLPQYDTSGRELIYSEYLKDVDSKMIEVTSDNSFLFDQRRPAEFGETPNLVSSKCCIEGEHKPILDLDFACRLLPSRTAGHYHLYIDGKRLPTEDYGKLLRVMNEVGLIQNGIIKQFESCGATFARINNEVHD